MKKLMLIFAVLFPSIAIADYLPAGCYVADYYRTDSCWHPINNSISWTHSGNRSLETNYYGDAVETILFESVVRNEARNKCIADYNSLVGLYNNSNAAIAASNGQYNALLAQFNTTSAALASANRKIVSLNKTIKKLKKK